MTDKKQIPIQIDAEIKAALDKHQIATGSKSYRETIAKLLGVKETQGKNKKHAGPTPGIIDAAILQCWTLERIRDKSRAEIIHAVRQVLEISIRPSDTTWKDLYPKWFEESLDDYVDDRLKSLKRRGFIVNKSKGIWSMSWTTITTEETRFLYLVFVYIEPHKQLNIPAILKDRD